MAAREADSIAHLTYNMSSAREAVSDPNIPCLKQWLAMHEAGCIVMKRAKPLLLDLQHSVWSSSSDLLHLNFTRVRHLRLRVSEETLAVLETYVGILGKLLPQLKHLHLDGIGYIALSKLDFAATCIRPGALETLELAAGMHHDYELREGLTETEFATTMANVYANIFKTLGASMRHLDVHQFQPLQTGVRRYFPDPQQFQQLQCFTYQLGPDVMAWEAQLEGLAFPTLKRLVLYPPRPKPVSPFSKALVELLWRFSDAEEYMPSLAELDCSAVVEAERTWWLWYGQLDNLRAYDRWLTDMKTITSQINWRFHLKWLKE